MRQDRAEAFGAVKLGKLVMILTPRPLVIGLAVLLGAVTVRPVQADGGTVRLSARKGTLQVSVFTSPTPPRAGVVDVSVLVQEAATGRLLPDAKVLVEARPRGRPDRLLRAAATHENATNKLLVAADLDLPNPGWWQFDVRVEAAGEPVTVSFEMDVGDAPPRWRSLLGWVAWPGLAVALYALHLRLVRRKQRAVRGG